MHQYEGTVMLSKATKGDQNSQSLNENKTGDIIYYRIITNYKAANKSV